MFANNCSNNVRELTDCANNSVVRGKLANTCSRTVRDLIREQISETQTPGVLFLWGGAVRCRIPFGIPQDGSVCWDACHFDFVQTITGRHSFVYFFLEGTL